MRPAPSPLRDSDSAERVLRLRAILSGVFGGALGAALGALLVYRGASFWILALCVVVGWAGVTGLTLLLTHTAGSAAATLYSPSGRSTPRKREYSQEDSLVARGLYREAVTAFEIAAAEDPAEPTPYLRVARIYRDHLSSHEDAARWFRRALREAQMPPGLALLARKELVELFVHRMGSPERALPELARLAEEHAGTPDGEWAADQVREIKGRMSEGEEGR